MDRITRHDLKHDQFVEQVGHIVEEVEAHRSQVIRYAVVAIAAIAIAAGAYWFIQSRSETRSADLGKALRVWDANIGGTSGEFIFATPAEKDAAVSKALADVVAKHSGSKEAGAAQYLMGIKACDAGKLDDAERNFKQAVEDGGAEYGSLAKLALADIYAARSKTADAEKLLKELIEKPTVLVSKDQATIALAKLYLKDRPAEARKLLEPLKSQSNAVGRIAGSLMAESLQSTK